MGIPDGYRSIGRGQNVHETDAVEGPLRWLETPQDVVEFVQGDDVEQTIVLSRGGTTTFMAPALTSGCLGLITLQGGPQSHLGIVSREFGIACVMSVRFTEGRTLEGGDVIPEDGTIVRLETTTSPNADVLVKEA